MCSFRPGSTDNLLHSTSRLHCLSGRKSCTAAYAASEYEEHKRSFLYTEEECREQGILFVPIVAETSGGWGPSAMSTFKRLAKQAAGRGGLFTPDKAVLPQFLERASIAIRTAKARAVLRRACLGPGASANSAEVASSVLTDT